MDYKNKKLIFIDVDGTLLNKSIDLANQSDIHSKNIEIINKLSKDGHKIVLMAGRPLRLTIDIYNKLNLRDLNINLSGSHINNPSDLNFNDIYSTMNKNKVQELMNDIKGKLRNLIIESSDKTYLLSNDNNEWFNLISKRDGVVKYKELNFEPHWIYLEADKSLIDDLGDLKIKYKDDFYFRIWWIDDYLKLEVGQSKINKGTVAKYVAEYYDIEQENIIAIGDNVNDKDILEYADISVSMLNAPDEIKKISKYVTKKDNSEGGLGYFLEELFYN